MPLKLLTLFSNENNFIVKLGCQACVNFPNHATKTNANANSNAEEREKIEESAVGIRM